MSGNGQLPIKRLPKLLERQRIAEFLRLPLLVTFGFTMFGVLVAVADISAGGPASLRRFAAAVVPGDNSREFVGAVATTIVTVTSITFSVLLLAVQQTASSLTAVIFDQFLRRRGNQLYFGFFVGLSGFCFVVFGMARTHPESVFGGAITLVLVIVALPILLLLIHGTIDQMRPQSVVHSIHELALRARARELDLLCRTRESAVSEAGRPAREVTVEDSGYVIVSSSESRQAQTCAELLNAFGGAAKRLRSESDRIAFDNALDSALPAVIQHAEVPALREALGRLSSVLVARGHEAARVIEVSTLLADATQRLLPKPSDEPEAAHPRVRQDGLVSEEPGPSGPSPP